MLRYIPSTESIPSVLPDRYRSYPSDLQEKKMKKHRQEFVRQRNNPLPLFPSSRACDQRGMPSFVGTINRRNCGRKSPLSGATSNERQTTRRHLFFAHPPARPPDKWSPSCSTRKLAAMNKRKRRHKTAFSRRMALSLSSLARRKWGLEKSIPCWAQEGEGSDRSREGFVVGRTPSGRSANALARKGLSVFTSLGIALVWEKRCNSQFHYSPTGTS
ncbi:hypothetical protein AVEN_66822-1 [Araneus ventricosus]|uniref:Uncharacterized protein n=1 Tax=Araneus ventricosus TaxID=182803 RepID=A0A4Y2DNT2_ARAVE|nr:hypothetical protein AVEN_66822-1 [Araneus ventricosus]